MVSRSLLKRVGVVAVVLLVVVGGPLGYLGYSYGTNPPSVESVNSQWGEVSDEETQVETTVVVDNPNSVGLPGVVGIKYTTKLNDVVLMEGTNPSISLSSGRNELSIPATMENRAIAEWWVTHVNNGEESDMTITASVVGPGGFEQTVSEQSSSLETEMLASMNNDDPQTVTLQGEEFLVLKQQEATWGDATMESTPLQFTAVVENRHDYPLTLDGLGYVITMNDVTVGSGQTTEGVTVESGETGTIQVDAGIDTETMATWWATHVRQDESTEMHVSMFGLVERGGELKRVPFELVGQDLAFETDMLEGGAPTVEPIENEGGGPSYEPPTLVSQSRKWGAVTNDTSEIVTTATLDNPNNGTINDFVRLEARQDIAINGVTVANGTSDLGTLEPGNSTVTTSIDWNNSATSNWWARHVNNGETSERRLVATTRADLGFTKLDVRRAEGNTTFETDMLSGLENDETQVLVTEDRTEVAELQKTRASWGTADNTRSPIEVDVTIKNTFGAPLTFEELQYTITMNEVVAGNGTAPESHEIQPGETETVTFTLAIDSQKMDDWWGSHIRNDEQTQTDFDASIVIESGFTSERVDVEGLTSSRNITTDFLGTEE
jgi:LEA14-like dessication related protein